MANSKISALTAATTPLAGTEVLPVVQSGVTKQVSVANLTAGRSIAVNDVTASGELISTTNNARISLYRSTGTCYFDWASGQTLAFGTETSQGGAGRVNKVNFTDAGNIEIANGNLVQGTAAKGINFTANSAAAGMTSQLLNWYEEGTYTPTFTADSGTAPSVGNGTLTGAYTRIGRLVQSQIKLVLGSTTTMGSGGVIQFGIPFSASSSAGATGTAYIDDTGTGWTIGFPTLRTSSIVDISLAVPGTIGTTRVTNTAPMTWATGDSIVISFVYFV